MLQIIYNILLFIVVIMVQLLCNNVCLFNVATPIALVYFLLKLPQTVHLNWVMTIFFLVGVFADTLSETLGMNALACLMVAVTRKPLLLLFVQRDDDATQGVPSFKSMGLPNFMKYATAVTLVYCFVLFSLQSFTLNNILLTVLRVVCSTVLSVFVVFVFECIGNSHSEKGL